MTANYKIQNVVIVGGGSAGWLSAGVLAATLRRRGLHGISITLVEAPEIATIGVGEGTWPSMRTTLQSIGISETDFIRSCDAAFKQGTCFEDWLGESTDDRYLHPFTLPQDYHERNAAADWLARGEGTRFSDAVSAQGRLAPQGLAPKSISTPEYAFYLNYGYHLNAGKFAEMLRAHCVDKLGVVHRQGKVRAVQSDDAGSIAALDLADGTVLRGDFFIDCSGARSLLLGEHLGVAFRSCSDILFNDTALAVQVPYADPDTPVASCTVSTAKDAGWIWDIGLSNRRGVGYVYSDAHCNEDEARSTLAAYLAQTGARADVPEARKIRFRPGHRETFWRRNCVAIGMAAGFIEPLEASALVLVELSARYLAEDFPVDDAMLPAASRRFNRRFLQHWEMIIDFLKLHYVLSRRGGAYWEDHRAAASIPGTLADRLALWRHRPPWHQDAVASDDMFPPASFQYILYGMGYGTTATAPAPGPADTARGRRSIADEVARLTGQLQRTLPTHRELLETIRGQRLPVM